MEKVRTIPWNPSMVLADLQNVAVSGECVVLELPEDHRVLVTPSDGLETLRLIMNSSIFVESLTKSLSDVAEGSVQPFDEQTLANDLGEE